MCEKIRHEGNMNERETFYRMREKNSHGNRIL